MSKFDMKTAREVVAYVSAIYVSPHRGRHCAEEFASALDYIEKLEAVRAAAAIYLNPPHDKDGFLYEPLDVHANLLAKALRDCEAEEK